MAVRAVASGARADRIVAGDDPSILSAALDDSIGLAIWRRPVPPAVSDWLSGRRFEELPAAHVRTTPDRLGAVLAGHITDANALVADLEALGRLFAKITDNELIDLRLAAVNDDACRRFHVDKVRNRLITTYLGPATEMVPASHAADALDRQRDYDGPLDRVETGAVVLFRGGPDGETGGVVHRSPPILGTRQIRLVATFNEPTLVPLPVE